MRPEPFAQGTVWTADGDRSPGPEMYQWCQSCGYCCCWVDPWVDGAGSHCVVSGAAAAAVDGADVVG